MSTLTFDQIISEIKHLHLGDKCAIYGTHAAYLHGIIDKPSDNTLVTVYLDESQSELIEIKDQLASISTRVSSNFVSYRLSKDKPITFNSLLLDTINGLYVVSKEQLLIDLLHLTYCLVEYKDYIDGKDMAIYKTPVQLVDSVYNLAHAGDKNYTNVILLLTSLKDYMSEHSNFTKLKLLLTYHEILILNTCILYLNKYD